MKPAKSFSVASLATCFAVAAILTGCTPVPPQETTTPTVVAPSTSSTPSTAPSPVVPELVVGGSAAENLPFFTDVVNGVWSGPEPVSGRAYIDALAGAGFDRAAMQVTPDQTTVGDPAESIQFAVAIGSDCLLGQVGPATGGAVTSVATALADGTCLIGTTRPIDW